MKAEFLFKAFCYSMLFLHSFSLSQACCPAKTHEEPSCRISCIALSTNFRSKKAFSGRAWRICADCSSTSKGFRGSAPYIMMQAANAPPEAPDTRT